MVSDCCIVQCRNRRTVKKRSQALDGNPEIELDVDEDTDVKPDLESDLEDTGPQLQAKEPLHKDRTVMYHGFPRKNPAMLEEWIKKILPFVRNPQSWNVTKCTRICSDHFRREDYYRSTYGSNTRLALLKTAVPTIFPGHEVPKAPEASPGNPPEAISCDRSTYASNARLALLKTAVPTIFPGHEVPKAPEASSGNPPEAIFCDLLLSVTTEEQSCISEKEKTEKPRERIRPIFCAALGCTSKFQRLGDSYPQPSNSDISFHRLPHGRPEMLERWVVAIGQKDFQPVYNTFLCSLHFTSNCFRGGPSKVTRREGFPPQRRLRTSAVPTLFSLPPQHLMGLVDTSAPYLQPRVTLGRVDAPQRPTALLHREDTPKQPSQSEELEAQKESKKRAHPGGPKQPKKLKQPRQPDKSEACGADPDMDTSDPKEKEVTPQLAMHDHKYIKQNPEEEIGRLRALLEDLKDKVMSASHRVKSLKISVSALKYQYQMETQSLDKDGPAAAR